MLRYYHITYAENAATLESNPNTIGASLYLDAKEDRTNTITRRLLFGYCPPYAGCDTANVAGSATMYRELPADISRHGNK